MRILHVVGTLDWGGTESVVVNLANGQAASGHRVAVAAGEGRMWQELRDDVARYPRSGMGGPTLRNIKQIRRLLKAEGWDIVHTHQRSISTTAWLARRGLKTHHVEHVHNVFLPATHRMGSFRGEVLVACGSRVAEMVVRDYGRAPSRVELIPNGVPDHGYRRRDRGRDSVLRVTNIARVAPQKDPLRFIRAIGAAVSRGFPIEATWVGDGELMDAVTREVKSLGLEGRVRFVGAQRPATRWMAETDVLMSTSRWEGLPLTLVEACAAGVPIVATDAGSVSDVVHDGENGVLLHADASPEELGQAIGDLATDGGKLRYYGDRSRQFYDSQFTVDMQLNRVAEIYERIMGER
jgi:glycosyltransferase involved in cell wall biosynthesis